MNRRPNDVFKEMCLYWVAMIILLLMLYGFKAYSAECRWKNCEQTREGAVKCSKNWNYGTTEELAEAMLETKGNRALKYECDPKDGFAVEKEEK